ncbi:MAG: cell division protein ZapA [Clostridia bacterium]
MAAERSETPWVKVRVRIDGDELAIRGQGTEEYVRELARIVDSRIERVRRSHPNLPRHHAAILACMYLADEAYKLRQENKELEKLLEEAR